MKGLIVKGSSLTCQGKHLNAIIYNKNDMSQAQNFQNPLKFYRTPRNPPGWFENKTKKRVFPNPACNWGESVDREEKFSL